MTGNAELNYDRKDLEVISAMRDFSAIMYGKSAARMGDDDPRLEIDSGAKLVAFFEAIGLNEACQRDRIHNYDQAKEALTAYRLLKSGVGTVPVNRVIALRILKANLSDGAKIAALAGLLIEAKTARDIATITNRSLQFVERHYAELRTWECAELRRDHCAMMRSCEHSHGASTEADEATNRTARRMRSP